MERSIENHFELGDIKELKLIAHAIEQPLRTLHSEHSLLEVKQRLDDILVGHHHPLLRITDARGNLIYNSSELDLAMVTLPSSVQPDQEIVQQWSNTNNHYRVLIQQLTASNNALYTIIIAVSTDFHQHFLANFRLILWGMVALGIIVMSLMSWLAVRYGHRPLHRIIDQISHISSNELSTRLAPESVPIELAELAVSFNDLLQRMDEAFDQLSNFSADIAHELRTPVTNLMTQTQVVLSKPRSLEEYQETLYSNMEEFERLSQMISDMLFLAKTDNTCNPLDTENIDLYSEIKNLFDYYEAWAEENMVTLVLEGKAQTHGNRLMLRRVLSNLLSNAIRHTAEGHSVTVIIESDDSNVHIVVQNPGEPILSKHLPKLFDRFYRADPSRQRTSDGTGLGLSITRSIIEAHGGNIIVTSDEIRTQFQITLPIKNQENLPLKSENEY